jgi:hypothetical protein
MDGTHDNEASTTIGGSRLWSDAVVRRAFAHPLAPVLAAAGAGLLCLIAAPATADMSAHTFRAWLWDTEGSVLWNAQWYGGHHAAGYSMLFPPLAGLVGPRAVGALAGVAAVIAFAWLATNATRAPDGPSPGAARLATWLFASGIAANVVIGRMPFTLGVACAVAAWACAVRSAVGSGPDAVAAPRRRARARTGVLGVAGNAGQWGPVRVLMGSSTSGLSGRGGAAAVGLPETAARAVAVTGSRARVAWALAAGLLAFAATWASPVAGLFLCTAAAGPLIAGGRAGRARAALLVAPAFVAGLAIAIAFPEGGPDRFVATAFWPMLALCVWAVLMLAERPREVRASALVYLVLLVGAFALPTPLGQNALRPGVLLGPSLLVLFAQRSAPRALLIAAVALLVYLQWLPAVRAISEAAGDPSTKAAFYTPLLHQIDPLARPGDRVEVPLTRNHWESAYVAEHVPLARGWHRQLDRKANPLFYGDRPLNAATYLAWLQAEAVRWVALPKAALDVTAKHEAALLRAGVPGLRVVWRSPDWTVWEVAASRPVDGPARLTESDPEGFELVTTGPGTAYVRQHWTPYWTVTGGDACVTPSAGGFTLVRAARAERVRVRARLSLRAALRQPHTCPN